MTQTATAKGKEKPGVTRLRADQEKQLADSFIKVIQLATDNGTIRWGKYEDTMRASLNFILEEVEGEQGEPIKILRVFDPNTVSNEARVTGTVLELEPEHFTEEFVELYSK